jgi:hypothetical protein
MTASSILTFQPHAISRTKALTHAAFTGQKIQQSISFLKTNIARLLISASLIIAL